MTALWRFYAKHSIRAALKWRVSLTMRCSKCLRRRWAEEIVTNCGWCERCFDASWDAYMAMEGDSR